MSVSKVSIRKKPITNGRDSLYLEFSPALLDMKTMRRVYKEHLHIYLYQKPKTNQHKEYNRRMMERAEGIRAIRVQQILNDEFSFLDKTTMKGDFMEYYRNLALEKKFNSKWWGSFQHFEKFMHGKCSFEEMNVEVAKKFSEYLMTATSVRRPGQPMHINTKASYFSTFRAVLKRAYRDKLIKENINEFLDKIEYKETKREYLTLEELKRLADTPCDIPVLRRAAIFSCFTGLRVSDIMTRTSFNQGVLQTTGFVNTENINSAGNWSLGLLQMDFFYRRKPWYAGQFVRKVLPKFEVPDSAILFFSTLLNGLKRNLLSVLVRDVDKTFLNSTIQVPIKDNGDIDFGFIAEFVAELEAQRVAELATYLQATGLKDYRLTTEEKNSLEKLKQQEISWAATTYQKVFDNIKQGRRLKKEDQLPGDIPFVMAGTTNTGVVGYISNPIAYFPQNSITIDIFGNTFYRNYSFGAGDDTGVYWNNSYKYSEKPQLLEISQN